MRVGQAESAVPSMRQVLSIRRQLQLALVRSRAPYAELASGHIYEMTLY